MGRALVGDRRGGCRRGRVGVCWADGGAVLEGGGAECGVGGAGGEYDRPVGRAAVAGARVGMGEEAEAEWVR